MAGLFDFLQNMTGQPGAGFMGGDPQQQQPGLGGLLGMLNQNASRPNPMMQMGMGMMGGQTPGQGMQGGMNAMQRFGQQPGQPQQPPMGQPPPPPMGQPPMQQQQPGQQMQLQQLLQMLMQGGGAR